MKVIRIHYEEIPDTCTDCVACIGYFDGFHKGHQELMHRAIYEAKKLNVSSAIISFDPDPWEIFHPTEKFQHITTVEDRIHLAEALGFDILYMITFTKVFSMLSVPQFHDVLNHLHVKTLVCGFDFHYGYKNIGDVETLKEQTHFDVIVIESIQAEKEKISSSRIEPLIKVGSFAEVCNLLGFAYSIGGIVVHGFQRGTTLLNIPTANLEVDREYLLPSVGVYAGMVIVEKRMHYAMINVGTNPTFDNKEVTFEAHILDFDESIYDKRVRFCFLSKIRGEVKFDSILSLKNQLLKDIHTTKLVCKNAKNWIENTKIMWNVK